MGMNTQNVVFKIMTPCKLVHGYQRFRGTLLPPTSLEMETVSSAQNFRKYQPVYVVSYLNVKCGKLN